MPHHTAGRRLNNVRWLARLIHNTLFSQLEVFLQERFVHALQRLHLQLQLTDANLQLRPFFFPCGRLAKQSVSVTVLLGRSLSRRVQKPCLRQCACVHALHVALRTAQRSTQGLHLPQSRGEAARLAKVLFLVDARMDEFTVWPPTGQLLKVPTEDCPAQIVAAGDQPNHFAWLQVSVDACCTSLARTAQKISTHVRGRDVLGSSGIILRSCPVGHNKPRRKSRKVRREESSNGWKQRSVCVAAAGNKAANAARRRWTGKAASRLVQMLADKETSSTKTHLDTDRE